MGPRRHRVGCGGMRIFSGRNPAGKLALLAAVTLGAALSALFFNPQTVADTHQENGPPRFALALTAEARQALQSTSNAFPSRNAGFSAYYRVPNAQNDFEPKKDLVDQALHDASSEIPLVSGTPALQDTGGSHSVTSLLINNIAGPTTPVNVYYDAQGWVVAFFPRGTPSSQAWQAGNLNVEEPELTDVSHTVLLDAINAVLAAAPNSPAITPEDLGYYHWEFPLATNFLMIASASGNVGTDVVSFAVPESFTVDEVSVSSWTTGDSASCTRVDLDNGDVKDDRCGPGWNHTRAELSSFNQRTAHTMNLEHYGHDIGASGAMVMLVYTPDQQ